jgi:hypothetical protein
VFRIVPQHPFTRYAFWTLTLNEQKIENIIDLLIRIFASRIAVKHRLIFLPFPLNRQIFGNFFIAARIADL